MAVTTRQDTQELLTASIGPACHELRSPLAVVYGFARMLDSAAELDESSQRYVAQIVSGAQRLDTMLDLLSKIGRVATGRLQPTIEQTSLRGVIANLCSTSTNSTRVHVEEGPDLAIKADPAWLSEALDGIVDSVCFEEGMGVRISWTHDAHEAQLQIAPTSTAYPMVDIEPEKSSLALSLARVRIVAMNGSLDASEDRLTVTVPRA